MKLKNGKITILVGGEYIKIEIHDDDAVIRFCDIKMTPENFCAALGRLSHVECEVELRGLDRVGKKREHKEFIFKVEDVGYHIAKEGAAKKAKELCPDGWTPSCYFNSQNSFFSKDGKKYARTHIMRWVDQD